MKRQASLLHKLKFILYPFSLLYGLITAIRNTLYDYHLLRSTSFNIPIISVGNLSVGGTGKTPHILYLLKVLKKRYSIVTLSRGYKRQSKGFVLANDQANALNIGDEPMQLYLRCKLHAHIAVCENRVVGVRHILAQLPTTNLILLDDSFQHRAIQAGLSILLTDYNHLFYHDYLLPLGRLREARSAYKRADFIIVTKCPNNLSLQEQQQIRQNLDLQTYQQAFFSTISYKNPYHLLNQKTLVLHKNKDVLLLCAIAKPSNLQNYLNAQTTLRDEMLYSDHHFFTVKDLLQLKQRFEAIPSKEKVIITTEKDAARLLVHKNLLETYELPIYCLPITVQFLENDATLFEEKLCQYLLKTKKETL